MLSRRARFRSDLRRVSRTPIAMRALGEVLTSAGSVPAGSRLWLADRWPWTTGTGSALSELRPRWAVAVLDVNEVMLRERVDPEDAVRDLNRTQDPWPVETRRIFTRP